MSVSGPDPAPLGDEATTVAELRTLVATFIHQRAWEQFHDPKNLAMAIATEAAELMEHFRWVANTDSRELLGDPATHQAVAEEVADILAFLLSFANAAGIDLSTALRNKMLKNAAKYPVEKYLGRY